MLDFMAIAKALADENRVRLLFALQRQELCACQLVELIRLAPSTVSKHMSILKQARLVESRKEGRWVYYRLGGPDAPSAVRDAIAWVRRSLAGEPRMASDSARLDEILKMDPEALCEKQSAAQQPCSEAGGESGKSSVKKNRCVTGA
jgi:DNA-binding transcriptional ArsR family regulator